MRSVDCFNFLVKRLYYGTAKCHHWGKPDDAYMQYDLLQLHVNLHVSHTQKGDGGPQSLSCSTKPPARRLVLVPGQTSAKALTSWPCLQGEKTTVPPARPAAPAVPALHWHRT